MVDTWLHNDVDKEGKPLDWVDANLGVTLAHGHVRQHNIRPVGTHGGVHENEDGLRAEQAEM